MIKHGKTVNEELPKRSTAALFLMVCVFLLAAVPGNEAYPA